MTKGAYDINETKVGPTKDGSFRSMLCAMLVFVAICGIIIIVAWPWKTSSTDNEKSYSNSLGSADQQTGNKNEPTKDQSTTAESVRTTSSFVHKSTQKTEKPPEPVTQSKDQENFLEDDVTTVQSEETHEKIVKPNENPNESVETLTEDKHNSSITNSTKENEKIILPSTTTVNPVTTTQSHVDNSTQKTENSSKPENQTEVPEPTLITGTADISNNSKYNNNSDVETTTPNTTVNPNSEKDSREVAQINDTIATETPKNENTTIPETLTAKDITKPDLKENITLQPSNEENNTLSVTTETPVNDTAIPPTTTTIEEITNTDKNENKTLQSRNGANELLRVTTEKPVNETTNVPITSTIKEIITNIDESPLQFRNESDELLIVTTEKSENETTILPTISTIKEITKIDKNETTVTVTTEIPGNETTILPITSTVKEITQTDNNETLLQPRNKDEDLIMVITTEKPNNESTTLPTHTTIKEITKTDKNESTTLQPRDENNELVAVTTETLENDSTTLPTTQKEIMETDNVDQNTRITEPPPVNQNSDECNAECRKVGARILSRMKHSADPCEQFYDYACGGDNIDNAPEDNWKRIAEGLNRIQPQSPDVYKTFQNFYESCVDFHTDYNYNQRVFEAKDLLWSVGQPYSTDVDEDSALTNLLTRLLQLDSLPLFDISVDVDKEDHFIFQLNIGKQFSNLQNDNSMISSKRKCLSKAKKHLYSLSSSDYMNLNEMQEVYSNCVNNVTYKTETVEDALEALDMYSELEFAPDNIEKIIEIYKKFPSAASIREGIITKQYDVRKVSELMFHYPLIKWKQILKNLVGKDVHDEDLVQVYFKDFFFKLFSRNQQHGLTKPELYNAILAMYIHDLYVNFVLPTPMEDPEEFCLHQSSDLMKEVASSLYLESIKQNEYEGDLKRVNDLFGKMKTKLVDMINHDAEWVGTSNNNKLTLIKKINKMKLDTAWNHIPLWKNISLIQERMKSINRIYGNYSDFTAALVTRNRQLLYNMWDNRGDMESYVWWHFLTPYSTDPVSIYVLNRIAIPPAMLLTNSKDLPRYLSLAKLGYSLAKAVGYHFDTTGSRFDMSLDTTARLAYKEAETCTKSMNFNKTLKVEHNGKNLQFEVNDDSFKLTLNERFVEDMAIHLLSEISIQDVTDYQISWIASNPELVETFSREKLFFIALGQEHCRESSLEDYFLHVFESEHLPPSLVLNIALSHSELFTKVFDCKDGSPMNAVLKCAAFPVWQEPEPEED